MGGIFAGWNFRGWNFRGWNFRGWNFPGTKNTYGYMYFYTFFNNNTMHLIVLLLKIRQLKKETSVI